MVLERPDAPGKPSCATRSLNHIEISWKAPFDGGAPIRLTIAWAKPKQDGGNPVAGYIVEKRKKETDRWIP